MKNEPVAWMVERTTGTKGYGDTPYVTLLDATKSTYWIKNEIPEGYTVIPLYTHPVKEQDELFDRTASHMAGEYVSWTVCLDCGKRVTGDSIHTCSPQLKLTDEEIKQLAYQHRWNGDVEFARAILRKAQEK